MKKLLLWITFLLTPFLFACSGDDMVIEQEEEMVEENYVMQCSFSIPESEAETKGDDHMEGEGGKRDDIKTGEVGDKFELGTIYARDILYLKPQNSNDFLSIKVANGKLTFHIIKTSEGYTFKNESGISISVSGDDVEFFFTSKNEQYLTTAKVGKIATIDNVYGSYGDEIFRSDLFKLSAGKLTPPNNGNEQKLEEIKNLHITLNRGTCVLKPIFVISDIPNDDDGKTHTLSKTDFEDNLNLLTYWKARVVVNSFPTKYDLFDGTTNKYFIVGKTAGENAPLLLTNSNPVPFDSQEITVTKSENQYFKGYGLYEKDFNPFIFWSENDLKQVYILVDYEYDGTKISKRLKVDLVEGSQNFMSLNSNTHYRLYIVVDWHDVQSAFGLTPPFNAPSTTKSVTSVGTEEMNIPYKVIVDKY